jgi:steroid Delta-isomerase
MSRAPSQSEPEPERLKRLVRFYETLAADTVRGLSSVYAPGAHFKDPFNDVRGVAAITRIFEHMLVRVDAPRFVIKSRIEGGDDAFLTWDFLFNMRRVQQCIHGATHIVFDADGLVVLHRDYWDAAEELYEKIPLLGGFMRLLKRVANR